MIAFCTALGNFLRDDVDLSGLVGQQVFLSQAPPVISGAYLTFLCVSDVPLNQTHDGEALLWRARVQIEGWSPSPDQADIVRQAVMHRMTGMYFGGDMAGITVQSAAVALKRGVLLDTQSNRWKAPVDYFVTYEAVE